MHWPTVLVLDEPSSGLDPRSRVDLRELLRAEASAGTTALRVGAVVLTVHRLRMHARKLGRGVRVA